MAHDLIFQLLEPLMEFHMVLICGNVVVLPSSSLAPEGFGVFESFGDLAVENSVPFASLTIQFDGQNARLDAELEQTSTVSVWRAHDAFLALIASRRTPRDVTAFRPW
jgi:hypothetical protein